MKSIFMKAKHVPGKPKGMLGALFDEQVNNSSDWLTDDHIRGMMIDIVIAGMNVNTILVQICHRFLLSLFQNDKDVRNLSLK